MNEGKSVGCAVFRGRWRSSWPGARRRGIPLPLSLCSRSWPLLGGHGGALGPRPKDDRQRHRRPHGLGGAQQKSPALGLARSSARAGKTRPKTPSQRLHRLGLRLPGSFCGPKAASLLGEGVLQCSALPRFSHESDESEVLKVFQGGALQNFKAELLEHFAKARAKGANSLWWHKPVQLCR